MKNFIKKLNEPFPESDSPKENVRNVIGVGIFITLFLFIFQVGGIHNASREYFWICANFGLITIVVSLIYDFVVGYIFKIDRNAPTWTLKKWIIYMFILLISITLANYAYFLSINNLNSMSLHSFLQIATYTLAVGIFPVVFSGLLIQINANKKNQLQAAVLQPNFPKKEIHEEIIELTSNNKSDNLQTPIKNIFFLEAMQNYVSVSYLKEGKVKKEMLRNTIKNIEEQLQGTPLIRCHRSFIVNSDLIENLKGNAQGLKLELKNLKEIEIPVSRKYIPILKEKIS